MGSERRREREKEQRRNAILRSARKEFFEKGFRAVTVDSIARRSELSKGAIYLYFKSKEEIYAQILLRDIDKFHEKVESLLDPSRSASDNLRRYAEVYAAFFISDRELFRIFMNFMIQHNPVNFTPNINDHIVRSTNQTVVVIEQILQMGIERGEFPRTLDIRVCRNALWGLLNGIIALHLFTGRENTREERVRNQVRGGLEVFIAGLRSV
ncbi:MAG: TetR/AcrR family transcriptional regulator [Syntrophobacterales bacterium]|nr:TetR/AcrR family transcriptional regulator [Syntrophobacterales bacterium]HNS54388.1 TetR/AcrR family transcriptional regulator [Syntrophales bacterium]